MGCPELELVLHTAGGQTFPIQLDALATVGDGKRAASVLSILGHPAEFQRWVVGSPPQTLNDDDELLAEFCAAPGASSPLEVLCVLLPQTCDLLVKVVRICKQGNRLLSPTVPMEVELLKIALSPKLTVALARDEIAARGGLAEMAAHRLKLFYNGISMDPERSLEQYHLDGRNPLLHLVALCKPPTATVAPCPAAPVLASGAPPQLA
mmetsp:Transcript_713/g.1492  ORF Transcript_713/g.1492 Transcript_713/m.1492 type:complete len:208 (-) Transcript_713:143-766(-)